jgi:hypothetical protein
VIPFWVACAASGLLIALVAVDHLRIIPAKHTPIPWGELPPAALAFFVVTFGVAALKGNVWK